jgi:hypothetical protein
MDVRNMEAFSTCTVSMAVIYGSAERRRKITLDKQKGRL